MIRGRPTKWQNPVEKINLLRQDTLLERKARLLVTKMLSQMDHSVLCQDDKPAESRIESLPSIVCWHRRKDPQTRIGQKRYPRLTPDWTVGVRPQPQSNWAWKSRTSLKMRSRNSRVTLIRQSWHWPPPRPNRRSVWWADWLRRPPWSYSLGTNKVWPYANLKVQTKMGLTGAFAVVVAVHDDDGDDEAGTNHYFYDKNMTSTKRVLVESDRLCDVTASFTHSQNWPFFSFSLFTELCARQKRTHTQWMIQSVSLAGVFSPTFVFGTISGLKTCKNAICVPSSYGLREKLREREPWCMRRAIKRPTRSWVRWAFLCWKFSIFDCQKTTRHAINPIHSTGKLSRETQIKPSCLEST